MTTYTPHAPINLKLTSQELVDRGYKFTQDWFTHNIGAWRKHVLPALLNSPVSLLEIGSYEGLSSVWLAANLLADPHSVLHCVDVWLDPEIRARFNHNINHTGLGRQVVTHMCEAYSALATLAARRSRFDFVYVDGDHFAHNALQEAAMAWPMLKHGGILVFDDYRWVFPQHFPGRDNLLPPKPGIDAFLQCWQGHYTLLVKEWQVIIQKH